MQFRTKSNPAQLRRQRRIIMRRIVKNFARKMLVLQPQKPCKPSAYVDRSRMTVTSHAQRLGHALRINSVAKTGTIGGPAIELPLIWLART